MLSARELYVTIEVKKLEYFTREWKEGIGMDGSTKERHPSLAAWLLLLAIANGLSVLMYGGMWITLIIVKNSADSTAQVSTALPTLALSGLISLICIFAVYKWKKWGLYGFALTTLITFSVYMKIEMNNIMAIMGLIGISVLVYLIRPHWDQMDNF